MKYALALMLLTGCAVGSFPAFPDSVKFHYMIDVRDKQISHVFENVIINLKEIPEFDANQIARCLKFEITSKVPYQIRYLSEVVLSECSGVGGYKPEDSVLIYNWVDDINNWASSHKRCFK